MLHDVSIIKILIDERRTDCDYQHLTGKGNHKLQRYFEIKIYFSRLFCNGSQFELTAIFTPPSFVLPIEVRFTWLLIFFDDFISLLA